MKRLIFSTFMLLCIGISAQTSLSLKLGPAIPLGDFGANDDGLAESGFALELSSKFVITENLSLGLLYQSQGNSIDAEYLADQVQASFNGTSNTVTTVGWRLSRLYTVLNGQLEISEKLHLTGRLGGGLLMGTSPDIEILVNNQNNDAIIEMEESSSSSFGYIIGGGLLYDLSETLFLTFNYDVAGGSIEFDQSTKATTSNNVQVSRTTFDQSTTTNLILFGIGYTFN